MAKTLNHDSPWKLTVEKLTRSFLEVTFPEVAAGIDWSVEPKLFNDNYSSPLTTIRIPHLG